MQRGGGRDGEVYIKFLYRKPELMHPFVPEIIPRFKPSGLTFLFR